MSELQLTDATFEQEVLQSKEPVLVDFWAPWCGPCRQLSPVVDELAKEYAGKVKVAKLNTDEHSGPAVQYKIAAIPTLLFFKNGKLMDQITGVKSKPEIAKKLDALL